MIAIPIEEDRFTQAVEEIVKVYGKEGETITAERASQALAAALATLLDDTVGEIEHWAFGPNRRLDLDESLRSVPSGA